MARPRCFRIMAQSRGIRARRMQGIESDTGYDTRRRSQEGALARLSQTTVYDTLPLNGSG